MIASVWHAGRYPVLVPPVDYYALRAVADLFHRRPGCDAGQGLAVFQAIVDRTDLRPYLDAARTRPNPDYLYTPGFGAQELAALLDRPEADAGRYTRALEVAGVLTPLPATADGAPAGWRLNLAALQEDAGFLALVADGGGCWD
jgi:hypothetical protein